MCFRRGWYEARPHLVLIARKSLGTMKNNVGSEQESSNSYKFGAQAMGLIKNIQRFNKTSYVLSLTWEYEWREQDHTDKFQKRRHDYHIT